MAIKFNDFIKSTNQSLDWSIHQHQKWVHNKDDRYYQRAKLADTSARKIRFRGLTLAEAIMYRMDCEDAWFVDMDLRNVNAQQTDFEGSYFKDVDCRNGDFSGCNFKNSVLENVDFRGANLYGVDFRYCTMTNVTLPRTQLEQTKTTGLKGMSVISCQVDTNLKNEQIDYWKELDLLVTRMFSGTRDEFTTHVNERYSDKPYVMEAYGQALAFIDARVKSLNKQHGLTIQPSGEPKKQSVVLSRKPKKALGPINIKDQPFAIVTQDDYYNLRRWKREAEERNLTVYDLLDKLEAYEKNERNHPLIPTIPDFVGEYIEKCKKNNYAIDAALYMAKYGSDELVDWLNIPRHRSMSDQINDRENDPYGLGANTRKAQDIFARAWSNTYHVFEQRYKVLNQHGNIMLLKDRYGRVLPTTERKSNGSASSHVIYDDDEIYLTEKEIKNYDERLWVCKQDVKEFQRYCKY